MWINPESGMGMATQLGLNSIYARYGTWRVCMSCSLNIGYLFQPLK